jgi:hypothetical protein
MESHGEMCDKFIKVAKVATKNIDEQVAAKVVIATQKMRMAHGRLKGVISRQTIANENRTALKDAVVALFDKPDKPGWGMTNSDLVSAGPETLCF